MTLEQLLDCSADTLEKMSDAELLAYFEPFFKVTRPELAERPRSSGIRSVPAQNPVSFKMKQGIAKLAELGIDASHLLTARRKK